MGPRQGVAPKAYFPFKFLVLLTVTWAHRKPMAAASAKRGYHLQNLPR